MKGNFMESLNMPCISIENRYFGNILGFTTPQPAPSSPGKLRFS